jgi:hypothetical protein
MSAISGQTTVTTAGTEVVLGTQDINGPLMVKALDTNTDVVAIGNTGGGVVSVSTGMRLAAGDVLIFEWVGNLGSVMLDSAVNGEGVAWLALDV